MYCVISKKKKRRSKVIYGSAGAKIVKGSKGGSTNMVNERNRSVPCTRRKALETSLWHIKVRGKCVFIEPLEPAGFVDRSGVN